MYTPIPAYEVCDSCYGTVIGTCRTGAFLRLDNGAEAFAYTGLPCGTEVLCTVRRLPGVLHDRILVGIDAVLRYASRSTCAFYE